MNDREALLALSPDDSTLLKGAAILFVLLGHLGYIPLGGGVGVAIFLAVSGYGLNLSLERDGLRFYWRKRLRKVWLPYVFVGLFDLLFLRVRGAGPILCTVLGLDFDQLVDKTMWYVSYSFAWYLAFYLAARLTARLTMPLLRAALRLVLLLLASFLYQKLYFLRVWHAASCAGVYYLAFPLGVFLSELRRLRLPHRARLCFWCAVLFLSSAYLWSYYPFQWFHALLTATALMQLLALLTLVPLPGKARALLLWIGRYSYPIYLLEGLLLGVRKLWFAPLGEPLLIDLCFLAVTSAAAYVYWSCYQKLEAALLPKLD